MCFYVILISNHQEMRENLKMWDGPMLGDHWWRARTGKLQGKLPCGTPTVTVLYQQIMQRKLERMISGKSIVAEPNSSLKIF